MPIEHIIYHRPNLPRNTFLPEHTPGSQVVEVGKALGVRGLLAGCEDRQQQLAADPPGGFLGLAAAGVDALGGLQVLVVVAGDHDRFVLSLIHI